MTTEKQKERKKQQKRFDSNLLWFCKRHQRDWLIFFHLSILLSTKIIQINNRHRDRTNSSSIILTVIFFEIFKRFTVAPWLQRQINRSVRQRSISSQCNCERENQVNGKILYPAQILWIDTITFHAHCNLACYAIKMSMPLKAPYSLFQLIVTSY